MGGWKSLVPICLVLLGCRNSASGPEPVPAPDAAFAWGRRAAAPPPAAVAPPAPADAAAVAAPAASAKPEEGDAAEVAAGEVASTQEADAASAPADVDAEGAGEGGEAEEAGVGADAEEEEAPGDADENGEGESAADASPEEAAEAGEVGPAAATVANYRWPSTRWLHGVWSDGVDRVFVAAGRDGLFECRAGAEPETLGGPAGPDLLAGTGRGDDAIVVTVGHRDIGRYRNGSWRTARLPEPCTFFDRAVDLAVGADGTAYLAHRWGGLHVWPSGDWTTVPYPEEIRRSCEGEESAISRGPEMVGVAVLEDGAVYLVASPQLLFVREGDALAAPPFAENAAAAVEAGTRYSCVGPGAQPSELWIGTDRKVLIQIDRESGLVKAHRVDLFGGMRELLALPGDETVMVIAAQTDLGVLAGGRFRKLRGEATFAEGLSLSPDGSTVLAASRDGITVVVRDGW